MSNREYTTFSADVCGKTYTFKCWGTYGAHYCTDQDGRTTRYTYGNRPWESFRYETVLGRAIQKQPQGVRAELEAEILHKTSKAAAEKAEAMVQSFKSLHDSLSVENKKHLAESGIVMHDESDVRAVMGLMGLMKLMEN